MFRHLISSEGGATAWLATLLDSDIGGEVPWRDSFRSFIAASAGIEQPSAGIRNVELEQFGYDLIASWGEWTLIVEVKVLSPSIRKGQLQEYYDRARECRDRSILGFADRILFLFVTPRRAGASEFDSLLVGNSDVKAHIVWESILDEVERLAPRSPDSSDDLGWISRKGAPRIRYLLAGGKAGVVEWTPSRLSCRSFAQSTQALVETTWTGDPLRFRPLWSDPLGDEIYATLNDSTSGNVYLRVDSGSDFEAGQTGQCRVRGSLQFRVTTKARRSLRGAFDHFSDDCLWNRLSLTSMTPDDFVVDRQKLIVLHRFAWEGSREDLLQRAADGFRRFLQQFGRFLPKEAG